MAKRGRPPKVKPVETVGLAQEEVMVDTEELLEATGAEVLSKLEAAVETPTVKLDWCDYRNLFEAACSLANTLVKAQGKIHGDTAKVVIDLVTELDRAFPRA